MTAALDEVKAQEAENEEKRAALQKKVETGSLVQKNAELNQLAQIYNEDDLRLRRAKPKLSAAQRKAVKPLKAATATAEAAQARRMCPERVKVVGDMLERVRVEHAVDVCDSRPRRRE